MSTTMKWVLHERDNMVYLEKAMEMIVWRIWLWWLLKDDKERCNALFEVIWEGDEHHHNNSRVQEIVQVSLDTWSGNPRLK